MFDNLRRDWRYFIIHWQQYQHVKFLMRYFSTTKLILLSNGTSTISSSKHFFYSFSSDFSPCQLDFSLLGLECFGSFHLVSEFLVLFSSLTTCCKCWWPCVKLSLNYENTCIYGVRCMKKWRLKRRIWRSPKNG